MRCTRFQNVCPIAWSVLKRLPEDIFPTKKPNQILSMIPLADTRETPFFNRDHCLPPAVRCKSSLGIRQTLRQNVQNQSVFASPPKYVTF